MFSLWAMMAALLLAGNDLRRMDGPTYETLSNREVIAIDQVPPACPAAGVVVTSGHRTGSAAPGGDRAVLVRQPHKPDASVFGGARGAMFGRQLRDTASACATCGVSAHPTVTG